MKFLRKYEEKLPDGFVLDTLKEELDEAVETEDYERAKQIKDLMDQLIADNEEYKKKYGLGEYWYTKLTENISTRHFLMSRKEFFQYGDQVKKILQFMYPNPGEWSTLDGGIKVLNAVEYEKEQGRDYSVLNKVNTNIKLINTLVFKFQLKGFLELIKFIRSEREELFRSGGRYFHIIYDTIRSTEMVGEKSEEKVAEFIKTLIKDKFGVDIIPHREVTSSYKDMVLGIDITFNLNGKDYTVQVKPLKAYKVDGDNVKVESSGNIKKYSTDYIAFSGKDILLFQNKEVSISGKMLTIPHKYLVNK